MTHKAKAIMENTDNLGIYKKARKRYLEGRGISCSFCRYHLGENAHRYQRNWKRTSKRRHQWKGKNL